MSAGERWEIDPDRCARIRALTPQQGSIVQRAVARREVFDRVLDAGIRRIENAMNPATSRPSLFADRLTVIQLRFGRTVPPGWDAWIERGGPKATIDLSAEAIACAIGDARAEAFEAAAKCAERGADGSHIAERIRKLAAKTGGAL